MQVSDVKYNNLIFHVFEILGYNTKYPIFLEVHQYL